MAKIGPVAQDVIGYVGQAALTALPQVVRPAMNSAMVKLIDMAIDGLGKIPSAKKAAGRQLLRKKDVELAVTAIEHQHEVMAAAQGLVSNIGGVVSAVIGTPINITGIVVVQVRMVACIAHLYGYDLDDPRVRTALAMCLLGERELARQIASRQLPSTPLAVATSPVYDATLHVRVADRVLSEILADAAGKGLVTTIGRKTPVIGGGVGGLADWLDTRAVARCARKQLVPRRPMVPVPQPVYIPPQPAPQYAYQPPASQYASQPPPSGQYASQPPPGQYGGYAPGTPPYGYQSPPPPQTYDTYETYEPYEP